MTNEIIKNEMVSDNETLTEKFFSNKGRIGRMTYFQRSLAVLGIKFLLAFIIGTGCYIMSDAANAEMYVKTVIAVIALVGLIPQYFLDTKRLHDIGKDETLAKVFIGVGILEIICTFSIVGIVAGIANAASVVSLVFTLYLLFMKGEEVTNEYGIAK